MGTLLRVAIDLVSQVLYIIGPLCQVHMGVYLGGGDPAMAKLLLDGPNIGSTAEEISGIGVPCFVRRE